ASPGSAAGGGTGPPTPPNGQPSQSICAPRPVAHWLYTPFAPANKNSACTSQLHKADQPFAARHPHQSAFPRRATASLRFSPPLVVRAAYLLRESSIVSEATILASD